MRTAVALDDQAIADKEIDPSHIDHTHLSSDPDMLALEVSAHSRLRPRSGGGTDVTDEPLAAIGDTVQQVFYVIGVEQTPLERGLQQTAACSGSRQLIACVSDRRRGRTGSLSGHSRRKGRCRAERDLAFTEPSRRPAV